jgi:hypothetical protein
MYLLDMWRKQAAPDEWIESFCDLSDRGAQGDAGQHPAEKPPRRAPERAPGARLRGLTVFQHACKMGLEGIVSKRIGSRYRSGRSPDWIKFKNPEEPR